MEAERLELKEKGSDMDISKRKCYGYGDGGDGDGACPACGCRHMEARKTSASKLSVTFSVKCRNCGWETRRTVGIEVVTEQ